MRVAVSSASLPAVRPPLSFLAVLKRGLLAGAAAGVAAALVAWLMVERPIRAALAVEEARHAAEAGDHHEELFSRPTQVVGGMVAAVVVAVAIGVVFAVVFAQTRHRLPASTDFGRAVLLATVGFIGVALLPALKYPANPPGVGDPETVTARTLYYFSFLGATLVVAYLAFRAREWLAARGWAAPQRSAVVALGSVVAVAVLFAVWPANPDPIPGDISAGLLWQFRVYSLVELATLWAVLGLAFGLLLEYGTAGQVPARALRRSRKTTSRQAP
jgi:predicted cobalt transporter CbtA